MQLSFFIHETKIDDRDWLSSCSWGKLFLVADFARLVSKYEGGNFLSFSQSELENSQGN